MTNELKHRDSRRLRVNKVNANIEKLAADLASLISDVQSLNNVMSDIQDEVAGLQDYNPHYDTSNHVPASIVPGRIIFVHEDRTLYRGLVAGESYLAAGTPWPVVGYKEYDARISANSDTPSAIIIKDNIGLDDQWSYAGNGIYRLEICVGDNTHKITLPTQTLYADHYDDSYSVNQYLIYESATDRTFLYLKSFDLSGGPFSFLSNIPVRLRFYPPTDS